jgi:hypothetical protein
LANIGKDLDGSMDCISTFSSEDKKIFYKYLEKIDQSLEPPEKKQKALPSLLSPNTNDIINQIKKNIKGNLKRDTNQVISYTPTTNLEIEEVEKLDPFNNKRSIINIHSKAVKNETMAQVFVLNEVYFRGKLYDILKSKINSNEEFFKYCLESFGVSQPTVYRYLNVYYLIKVYPNILLSGFGVTDLSKYRKKIEETAVKDKKFCQLIKHGFPGIVANFLLEDPTIDIPDVENMDINKEQERTIEQQVMIINNK